MAGLDDAEGSMIKESRHVIRPDWTTCLQNMSVSMSVRCRSPHGPKLVSKGQGLCITTTFVSAPESVDCTREVK